MTLFPPGGRFIVQEMIAKFPHLFVNVDEQQRELTTRIAEQFAFTYGTQWGNKKRAGLGDEFRSKDSLAVMEPNGTISVWDMFSSGLDILVHDGDVPHHPYLPPSEATFMPVAQVNWLEVQEEAPAEDEDGFPRPVVCAFDSSALEAKIESLSATVQSLANVLSALVARPAPMYQGEARLGMKMTFTLAPKE